jgi:hypothetical protein
MSEELKRPIEVYVRHQTGQSALLFFHLNSDQRLQLIEALAAGGEIEVPVKLELSVLPQWITNPGDEPPHAVIPVRHIGFNIE